MAAARIVFMGTPAFAVPPLRALLQRGDLAVVVAVVTQPDRPAGRGRRLTPSPVKATAMERGIPVLQPTRLKAAETHAALRELEPDLFVVAAYGRILPPAVLDIPRLGCVNVHASLLPRHRGASPIAHAILAGDAETGVCIMRMEEGLDTGPVFHRRVVPIAADANTGTLSEMLAHEGAAALVEILPSILAGSVTPRPQDESAATFAPLLDKEDGRIDFSRPAVVLERHVRAMTPWPGAFFMRGELRVGVLKASVAPAVAGAPGTVVSAGKDGIVVACGEGGLRIEQVHPAGRALMPAGAWVAGRGVAAGDSLKAD